MLENLGKVAAPLRLHMVANVRKRRAGAIVD
jgi:hypothetical protein